MPFWMLSTSGSWAMEGIITVLGPSGPVLELKFQLLKTGLHLGDHAFFVLFIGRLKGHGKPQVTAHVIPRNRGNETGFDQELGELGRALEDPSLGALGRLHISE